MPKKRIKPEEAMMKVVIKTWKKPKKIEVQDMKEKLGISSEEPDISQIDENSSVQQRLEAGFNMLDPDGDLGNR